MNPIFAGLVFHITILRKHGKPAALTTPPPAARRSNAPAEGLTSSAFGRSMMIFLRQKRKTSFLSSQKWMNWWLPMVQFREIIWVIMIMAKSRSDDQKNSVLFHPWLPGCHFSAGLRTKLGFACGSKHVSNASSHDGRHWFTMAEEKKNATPLFSENQSKPPVDQKLNPPDGSRPTKMQRNNPYLEVQDRTKNIPITNPCEGAFSMDSILGLEGIFWSESIPTLPQTSGPRPWRSTAPLGEEPSVW